MLKSELVKRLHSQNPHLRLGDVERILDVILGGYLKTMNETFPLHPASRALAVIRRRATQTD
jgi:hypothetical protein